jgi:hypothetical protein
VLSLVFASHRPQQKLKVHSDTIEGTSRDATLYCRNNGCGHIRLRSAANLALIPLWGWLGWRLRRDYLLARKRIRRVGVAKGRLRSAILSSVSNALSALRFSPLMN